MKKKNFFLFSELLLNFINAFGNVFKFLPNYLTHEIVCSNGRKVQVSRQQNENEGELNRQRRSIA